MSLPPLLLSPAVFFLDCEKGWLGWLHDEDDLTKLQLLLTNWPQQERGEGRLIFPRHSLFTYFTERESECVLVVVIESVRERESNREREGERA